MTLLLDQRSDLMPLRADFPGLVERLQRQRGRAGLRFDRLDDQTLTSGQARCFWTGLRCLLQAPPSAPLLIRSDLGWSRLAI